MKKLENVFILLICSAFAINLFINDSFNNRLHVLEIKLNALEQKDVDSQCIQWWIGAIDLEAARKRLCTKK